MYVLVISSSVLSIYNNTIHPAEQRFKIHSIRFSVQILQVVTKKNRLFNIIYIFNDQCLIVSLKHYLLKFI